MSRRQLGLTALIGFIFLAVLGVVYLQVTASARAYRVAWVAARELVAGEVLTSANVLAVRVAEAGDQFAALTTSPVGRRLAHRLAERDLLRADDLLPRDEVVVPITIRSGGGAAGDQLDVYASLGGRVVLLARGLTMVSSNSALVPAADEAFWIAIAASPTTLLAARSTGLDVGVGTSGVSTDDAIRHLVDVASTR